MITDTLALLLFAGLTLLSVAWSVPEYRTACDDSMARPLRRRALSHALVLDSFGTAFTVLALARLWPAVPSAVALLGVAPGLTAGLAVRIHDGFAGWLLDQIGR